MSKITNLETAIQEENSFVWILTAREKSKNKNIIHIICKDGPATDAAVDSLKKRGLSFITLTTDVRIREAKAGRSTKGWESNKNALRRRGIPVEGLYDYVLSYLDSTNEANRWVDAAGKPVTWYDVLNPEKPASETAE